MSVRCKLHLESLVAQTWGGYQATFRAVYDDTIEEDRRFQKATPTGFVQLTIDNPTVIDQLVLGKSYYFDMTPAD
jgi:hypothetical protein